MIISVIFFTLLLSSVLIYWLLSKQNHRNLFLSVTSIGFIFYFDHSAALLVVTLSIFSYFAGRRIEKSKRKVDHIFSISTIILVLIIFKNFGLFSDIINNISGFFCLLPVFEIEKILIPLGVSYIVFKLVSYLTDIYWGKIKSGTFLELFFYSSLFTIFVSGPIERFEKFQPQIKKKTKFSYKHIELGVERIVVGLFKKLVLADWMAFIINPVLQNYSEYSLFIRVVSLFGFSFQIYMDFSGYSDIAIGASRLFGIKIMENFNYPFLKSNIGDFWKCWHISLSLWVRDYVYIPLGGSRYGLVRKNLNAIIAMIIFGIWHEATWGFFFWGVYHGLGISVFNFWSKIKRRNVNVMRFCETSFMNYTGIILTFVFFSIGNLFFR